MCKGPEVWKRGVQNNPGGLAQHLRKKWQGRGCREDRATPRVPCMPGRESRLHSEDSEEFLKAFRKGQGQTWLQDSSAAIWVGWGEGRRARRQGY